MKSPLQRERERRNWTQDFVADQIQNVLGPRRGSSNLGIDANAVSRHERGVVAIPRQPYPILYAELYDTTVQALWPHAQVGSTLGHELPMQPLLAWMADHAGMSVQEAFDAVATRAGRLGSRSPAERYALAHLQGQVSRAQIAEALSEWYEDGVGTGFYRAQVGDEPLLLSMLVRDGWLTTAVKLSTERAKFRFEPSTHIASLTGEAATAAALDKLAAVETSGTVLVNHPVYRLLDLSITPDRLTATVALILQP